MGQIGNRHVLGLLLGTLLFTQACGRNGALPIPNSISDEEYSVYSAWIKHHFKEPPPRLLLASRTFIFDPLSAGGCNAKKLQNQGHVSALLLLRLHDLGEAEFPVQTGKFQLPKFKLPWKYEESDLFPHMSPPFRLVAFSRVVFNQSRTEGFFAVINSCGGGCGGGGPLIATRKNREWAFRSDLGCYWVY